MQRLKENALVYEHLSKEENEATLKAAKQWMSQVSHHFSSIAQALLIAVEALEEIKEGKNVQHDVVADNGTLATKWMAMMFRDAKDISTKVLSRIRSLPNNE